MFLQKQLLPEHLLTLHSRIYSGGRGILGAPTKRSDSIYERSDAAPCPQKRSFGDFLLDGASGKSNFIWVSTCLISPGNHPVPRATSQHRFFLSIGCYRNWLCGERTWSYRLRMSSQPRYPFRRRFRNRFPWLWTLSWKRSKDDCPLRLNTTEAWFVIWTASRKEPRPTQEIIPDSASRSSMFDIFFETQRRSPAMLVHTEGSCLC